MARAKSPARRRGRTLSANTLKVWRLVRDEGGWWSQPELVEALGLPSHEVCNARYNLMRNDFVAARRPDQTVPRLGQRKTTCLIGVTPACRVPNGETLTPVLPASVPGAATP